MSPHTISTSSITGAGFMKCMPITFSGLLVAEASRVMGMEEVLEARMVCGGTTLSSLLKISSFRGSTSDTASIIISVPASSSNPWAPFTLFSISAFFSWGSLPLWTNLSRFLATPSSALWRRSLLASTTLTSNPAPAASWAIPCPICPPPTIPNPLMVM